MLVIVNNIIAAAYFQGDGQHLFICMFLCMKAVNTMALISTLLNALAMAMDHYVAILKPLYHRKLMTKSRILLMITGLWILSALTGFSDFFSGIFSYGDYNHDDNYCEYVSDTKYQEEYPVFGIAIICLFVMMYVYIKIYITVRRHQSSEFRQINRNKKAMFTTLLLLGSFILCWLPLCLLEIIMNILVETNIGYVLSRLEFISKINQHLVNLLLLNAVCDPLIYGIRLTEVRRGYKQLIRKCCCRRGNGTSSNTETGTTRSYSLSQSYRRHSSQSGSRSFSGKSDSTSKKTSTKEPRASFNDFEVKPLKDSN
jgi:hypothetical protein